MKELKVSIPKEYLLVVKADFKKYRSLGEKTFNQLNDEDFHYRNSENENSIAIIIQHLSGNMQSRFTNFLTTDGEKPARNRDLEFEEQKLSKEELLTKWNSGWEVLFNAVNKLRPDDLSKMVKIRNEPHSVIEALNRQLTHCSYHVGQIVFAAKQLKKSEWKTLSIPKGGTSDYNKEKFEENK